MHLRLFHCNTASPGKSFKNMPLVTKQYKLVSAKGGYMLNCFNYPDKALSVGLSTSWSNCGKGRPNKHYSRGKSECWGINHSMLFLYKWQTFTVLLSQDFLRYWFIGRNSIKWRAAGHLGKVHVKLVKPSNLLSFLYYRHLHHSTVPKLNKRHANRIITGHSIKVS